MRSSYFRLAFMTLSILLVGCSSQPSQPLPALPASQSWEQHQQQLLPLTHWQVLGKIRIKTDEEDNSANLNWSQQPDHYRIYMAGPLGQGAVTIEGSEHSGIILDISGEGRYQADSPEQLLYQRLGWQLPISQLPFWIRGIPAPNEQHQLTLDTRNRLQQLRQNGWVIDYSNYHSDQRPELPQKIRLSRGKHLTLILILKQWQLGPGLEPL